MVDVRFINDTTPISVIGEQQQTSVSVQSRSSTSRVSVNPTGYHNTLSNRDLPDQHPIDAITGLREALNTFVFEQGIASDVWEIQHNLNKYPSVFVVDSSGSAQIPDEIVYNSENKITITFIAAFAGKAFLN